MKAELPQRFDTEEEAQKFLESLQDASFASQTSPRAQHPQPRRSVYDQYPPAGSQQPAWLRGPRHDVQRPAPVPGGKITYMRTDSVNLSGQALAQMSEYIKSEFGEQYHQVRNFKTKSASAQEAHEAIRPTDVRTTTASGDNYDQKLYDLIRRRTLASQMAPAKLEKTTVTITISTEKKYLKPRVK
jgi:DNA topoisomerase-1